MVLAAAPWQVSISKCLLASTKASDPPKTYDATKNKSQFIFYAFSRLVIEDAMPRSFV